MKTLRELGSMQQQKDAAEFGSLAHFLLRHRGSFSEACRAADEGKLQHIRGLTPRLLEILRNTTGGEISRGALSKAAITPNTFGSSPFADVAVISAGFIGSLAAAGAFDRMLSDGALREIPLQAGTVGAISVGATAWQIIEGNAKPMSRLSVTGTAIEPTKVHVALIITQELARSTLIATTRLIENELRNALAVASDAAFVASIISGITPATSNGTLASQVRSDIEWMLRQVSLSQTSRPYFLTTPAIAETLSMMNNGGESAFTDMGPLGGTISKVPVLVSNGVPAGYFILLDAQQIAAAAGEVALSEIGEALIQLDDTPASPPTAISNYQSLWQLNLTGLRAERFLIGHRLGASAVAAISNPNNYSGQGSP